MKLNYLFIVMSHSLPYGGGVENSVGEKRSEVEGGGGMFDAAPHCSIPFLDVFSFPTRFFMLPPSFFHFPLLSSLPFLIAA